MHNVIIILVNIIINFKF